MKLSLLWIFCLLSIPAIAQNEDWFRVASEGVAAASGGGNLTVSQIGTNVGTATPILIHVTNTWAAPGGIVVIGIMSGGSVGSITPTDSPRNNTYTVATNNFNTGNSCQIFCQYAPITTSLQSGDTISVAYTVSGATLYLAAYYVSSMKSSGAYDVGNTNISAFGTSAPSGTTPAVAGGQNEAAFVAYEFANTHTTTITAPYTQLGSSIVNVSIGYWGWNQVTTGTQSKTVTISGNDQTTALIAVFKSQ